MSMTGLLTASFQRTATGVSDVVDFGNQAASDHHISFSIAPAGNTFGASLEASMDGQNWDNLSSTITAAGNTLVSGKLYTQFRANVTAIQASSTLSINYGGR